MLCTGTRGFHEWNAKNESREKGWVGQIWVGKKREIKKTTEKTANL